MGCFNKTGKHYKSHFNHWIRDDIVEMAAEVGMVPSFPIPHILATRIATTESFGIIPVPKEIVDELGFRPSETPVTDTRVIPLHRGTPVNLLTRLSTRRVSPYDYLSERQQTAHAVVPVHTAGEYKLFKEMIKSGGFYKNETSRTLTAAKVTKTVNFLQFAKAWTEKVHEAAAEKREKLERIYYKLPEQLEKHHQLWVRRRGQNATLINTVAIRAPITAVLKNPA